MESAAPDQIVDISLPVDSPESDEALMLRYARGDGSAFEVLFQRHRTRVYGFIRRFVGLGGQADDLFQEVFFRIIRSRQTYRTTAKFTTWLYAITRSACIDAVRKEKRRTESASLPDCGEKEPAASDLHVVAESAREEAYQAEVGTVIERLIGRLPPEQREVLLMRERLDLPFKEIARITGCRIGTVKSRMRYALQALRRGLIAEGLLP